MIRLSSKLPGPGSNLQSPWDYRYLAWSVACSWRWSAPHSGAVFLGLSSWSEHICKMSLGQLGQKTVLRVLVSETMNTPFLWSRILLGPGLQAQPTL